MNSVRMTLRRVEPIPAAKLVGVVYGLLGLIIGGFASMAFMLGGMAGAAAGRQAVPQVFGILFGAGSIIFFPLLYGGMGFVGTLISCLTYNGLAGWLGGIQWDMQVTGNLVTVTPPGPPPPFA